MLLNDGHKVKALTFHEHTGIDGLDVVSVKGDVLEKESLLELFEGADIAIHLAAVISIRGKRDRNLERVNIEGTRNVLEAIMERSVKRLIHFSSIHALEHSPLDKPMDESRPLAVHNPLPYEKTKSFAEGLVREAAANGLDTVILNPSSLVGPNDFKPSLVGQLLIRLYNNQLPALVPGGYNWVDVRDVCQAAVNAIEQGRAGEGYILSGRWASLEELSQMVGRLYNRRTPTFSLPFWIARMGVPFIGAWYSMHREHPLYTSASLDIVKTGSKNILNKKAVNELGFRPRPLEETVADTIEFFKESSILE
jgi:dihydroflavonol-4-reductase